MTPLPNLAFMMARPAVLFLVVAGCCWGQADTAVTARLKAELREAHPYTLPATAVENLEVSVEPTLVLEPMLVAGSHAFEMDILAEARRATAVRDARKFSPLKGGLIYSSGRADLGFWPQVVPVDATPVKKPAVLVAVDLLRIKW